MITEEDIVKAAIDYSGRNDGVTLKTEIYAFMAAANWRIKTVWHDVSEDPKILGEVIILHNSFGIAALVVPVTIDEWITYKSTFKPDEWAYIQDLLPNKED